MDEHYEQSFRTRAKNGLVEKQIFVKEPTCNFNLQVYTMSGENAELALV